jgi:hypothetical protein
MLSFGDPESSDPFRVGVSSFASGTPFAATGRAASGSQKGPRGHGFVEGLVTAPGPGRQVTSSTVEDLVTRPA